ncbi:MAG: dihydroorotate dehydrogenase [Bacillota bacterium]
MSKNLLNVKLGDLELKNPIITASGTFGFGKDLEKYFSVEKLGAVTLKGITVEKSEGNDLPRIAESPAGIINSIGLENPGIEKFMDDIIPEVSTINTTVIANISGYSVKDFVYLAKKLAYEDSIDAIEVNVSCPNIKNGGMAFGTNSDLIYKITKEVRKVYDKTIIVKLSPNVTDIVKMAQAAESGGADIISLINTFLAMSIDIKNQKPVLANTFGGLSGPAIKPIALRMVYQIAKEVEIPIIGIGGIMSGEDAIEYLLAGATAVGIGTATLRDPGASIKILKDMKKYLLKNDIDNIENIIGKAQR